MVESQAPLTLVVLLVWKNVEPKEMINMGFSKIHVILQGCPDHLVLNLQQS